MKRRIVSRLVLAGATLALTGCAARDPASETPVQVKPGLYEAEMSAGFGPFSLGASETARRSCVTPDEVEHFPQVFTRRYLSMDGECDGPLSERKGNLVTGELTCAPDEDKVINFNYAATVSEQQVDVDLKGNIGLSAEALEQSSETAAKLSRAVTLSVAIKRVGDC